MRIFDPKPTYTAFFVADHSKIIYRSREEAVVPEGSEPLDDPRSSYFRTDGGDRFEFAWFSKEGRKIIVQRDGVPPTSGKTSRPG